MSEPPDPININDVLFAFPRAFSLDLKILRAYYGVHSLEIRHDSSSPFYLPTPEGGSKSLFVPSDSGISLLTVLNKSYEFEKVMFFMELAGRVAGEVTLIDIGANVGLFSRQCLNRIGNARFVHCYEPHPDNFELLARNLGGIERVSLVNKGLGAEESRLAFYEDPQNVGNYSLNVHAMPERFGRTEIDILPAHSQEEAWLSPGLPILYKSDTQGFDEIIATSLGDRVWQQVEGGSFELWRLADKQFDRERFARILDVFPNKRFEKNRQQPVSTAEVMEFLSHEDNVADDLLFWK